MGLFRVYKSSAGSGKTYTLVKEYLKIVISDPRAMKHILAITFTNAAAAEMKERIIHELDGISRLKDNLTQEITKLSAPQQKSLKLLREILSEIQAEEKGRLTESQAVDNARLVLQQILHAYADFSVSTIDSFVARIIRSFAFDLYLPMKFEVELDAELLIEQAVDRLIQQVGHNNAITQLLISFLQRQADDEKDARIETQIADMAGVLFSEEGTDAVKQLTGMNSELFLKISARLNTLLAQQKEEVKTLAASTLKSIEEASLSYDSLTGGKNGLYGWLKKLAEGDFKGHMPGSRLQKAAESDKWQSSKASRSEIGAIESLAPVFRQSYQDICGKDFARVHYIRQLSAIGRHIYPLGVLNELEKNLAAIRREESLLHISDFNKRISAIIAEQPMPFIYERLGERYHHYMIDEFQDTSALQWQNLLPLVDNGLAGGNLSLIVGDGKQAIYRFRNGDVAQFAALPALSPSIQLSHRHEWQASLNRHFDNTKSLNTNYRSKKAVVDFNNRFFSWCQQSIPDSLKNIYEGVKQNILSTKPGGYVEVSFADKDDAPEPENQGPFSAIQQLTAAMVLQRLSELRQQGRPWSDISILCRSRNEGSFLAARLMQQGIPVISSDSLLLSQSAPVVFTMAMLRLALNPADETAATEALAWLCSQQYLPGLQNDFHRALKACGLFRPCPGSAPLNQSDTIRQFEALLASNNIAFRFAELAHQNLFDCVESIIRHFFSPLPYAEPFMAFFSDAVMQYAEKNPLNLSDFIAWWDKKGDSFSLVAPRGMDAVQVMTIHKSKGLQFPVVIYPFANLDFSVFTRQGCWANPAIDALPELGMAWLPLNKTLQDGPFAGLYKEEQEKSWLDSLNLAYVAFTRAADALYIISQTPPKNNQSPPGRLSALLQGFLDHESITSGPDGRYIFTDPDLPEENTPAGIPEKIKDTEAEAAAGNMIKKLISNPWNASLKMRSHQAERSSLLGGDDALERGNLLHRAMEQIGDYNELEPVLKAMLLRGELDETSHNEWHKKISQLLSNPALKPYFAPGLNLRREAGILDAQGQFYRPDRVVIFEHEAVVIDYKTGKSKASHIRQMEQYALLLSRMGYASVKKLLVYLDENQVKTV